MDLQQMGPLMKDVISAMKDVVPVMKDVILAGAAIVGACVAIRGLSTWNRQLKGSTEYDLARRLLKLIYRLRDAINQVRSSLMWAYEMPVPFEEEAQRMSSEQKHYYGLSRAYQDYGLSRAYQARWQKVADIWSEIQAELLEAEALWGSEYKTNLRQCFSFRTSFLLPLSITSLSVTQTKMKR